ncbi:MAG: LPS export ABC transporter periplasmic protein LptC [Pseudomonadota bacterium]
MIRLLRDAWDRSLLYFPLVSMGLLALGTYWLVRSTPTGSGPEVQRVVKHEPDYFMENFSVRTFDAAGHVRSEVLGAKARHYPDTQWLEIDNIRVRSFDAQGRVTTATAQRGLTNEDSSELQLMGQAVIVRDGDAGAAGNANPRVEYRGEFLHAFMNTERIQSHLPVEFLRGRDRFSADRLDFDNVEQVLQLTGRVKATLTPAAN